MKKPLKLFRFERYCLKTFKEAAEYAGCPVYTIWELVGSGRLCGFTMIENGRIKEYVIYSDLLRCMEEGI